MYVIQKGFSLIELMIVVAIIGILAIIAIPAYQNYIARAQITEAFTLASGLKVVIAETFAQQGICLANTQGGVNSVPKPEEIKGQYVVSVTTDDAGDACSITAKLRKDSISDAIKDKSITLSMDKVNNAWSCTSDAEAKFLPQACKGIDAATAP